MAKYHYVYALTDPRKLGAPFYIGKGSGDRKVQHFMNVPKEMQGREGSEKNKIIQAIKAAGLQPSAIVLSHHEEEEDALNAERAKIKEIGLDNLTNMSIGGEGVKAVKTKGDQALTAKQQQFCQNIASGKFKSASDAYRDAYDIKTATMKSVNELASRELKKIKIASRIEELRAPVVAETQVTLEYCINGQKDAAQLASETGNAAAMTGAYRELGKLADVYPSDKSEVTIRGDELASRLNQGRAKVAEDTHGGSE